MNNLIRAGGVALLSWAAPLALTAQQPPQTLQTLRAEFRSVPPQARLRCYWWWLNGNTTEQTITRDLTAMSRKGYGGVLLVDANGSSQNGNDSVPPGPTFGSRAWTRLYLHALKTAASLHLEVTLNITSGWNLGGPNVKPADAAKLLTWSRSVVDGSSFHGALPPPPIQNGFYREIAVLGYPLRHGGRLPGEGGDLRHPLRKLKPKSAAEEMNFSMPNTVELLQDFPSESDEQDTDLSSVTDISSQVDASGHTTWRPPTGSGPWEILRIGYTDSDARVSTSSGRWQGLAIDYLEPHAFDTYWDESVKPLLEASRPYLKATLANLATDSWELGGTNWTGRFAAEFRQRRGYDPIPYMPVLAGRIVQDRGTSDRFLTDLRRTVADLITEHYDHFAERAREYGLGLQCESGGPHGAPLDALETFRNSAVPQTEYWAESNEHRSRQEDRYFTKEAASAADIYGKQFAANEGMTSIGPQWSESLASDLKPSFDQALTEGMNRLVWHEFTSSPAMFGLPGNEYFAGTHLNPNVTWWDQADDFILYLNRCQLLLQQGHSVDDVLYFYGDGVPSFVRLKRDDPAHVLPGYDYDVTDEDALLRTLVVGEGAIATPAGNGFRLLAMPEGRRLSLPSLERIATYVRQGGTLSGLPPLGPTGLLTPAAQARFKALMEDLWAACPARHPYGRGTVFCTRSSREVLRAMEVAADFESPSSGLDYIHRAASFADIYFIRNSSATTLDTTATFRAAGSASELWDPIDGSMTPIGSTLGRDGRLTIPLQLAPYGSVFVIFRPEALHVNNLAAKRLVPAIQTIPAAQWTIYFQPGRGGPGGPQHFEAFQSWASSPDPRIRYFSGTATYSTEVDLHQAPSQRVSIALSGLHEICTVSVNGARAGTIWAMPYRLDITKNLRAGRNHIELHVTNLWPNRIIGDAQPGARRTYTHTNIRKYTADSPLLPSGLIGPVTLETVDSGPQ